MQNKRYTLSAKVSSSNPEAVGDVLRRTLTKGTVRREGDEFIVRVEMEGPSAKELNRSLLSELRRAEKKTRIRSEWTCGDITERYFDYVLKKTTRGNS